MNDENERTTIAISPETKIRLRGEGKMGQTDDELINQLIDERKK